MENETETVNELQIVETVGESNASTDSDSTTNNIESEPGSKKRKMVKERSMAWRYFNKFTDSEGVKKARCKFCSEEYVADTKHSGTSNLLLHIPKCPTNPYKAEGSQTTLGFQPQGLTDLKKHKKCGGVDFKTELDKYLGEDFEEDHEKFNILGWWKLNSPRFPTLAEMARDVLAIPISSVASESAFSTGGRILDPFRSSLTPRLVQALVCVQDWLRNESTTSIKIEEDLDNLEQLEAEFMNTGREPCIVDI
uniref:Zinc finger BED domain-containing protein RICESLEEPER 2 n=1 Tax=Nicotiana tabacum TaxID=4097 RepID=A0A1S4C2F7_TOBAC|nr:PREDICTED: zinc finger BED domain-containing protein RICESLEEPER 2-like [Nicotiana tabacum]